MGKTKTELEADNKKLHEDLRKLGSAYRELENSKLQALSDEIKRPEALEKFLIFLHEPKFHSLPGKKSIVAKAIELFK